MTYDANLARVLLEAMRERHPTEKASGTEIAAICMSALLVVSMAVNHSLLIMHPGIAPKLPWLGSVFELVAFGVIASSVAYIAARVRGWQPRDIWSMRDYSLTCAWLCLGVMLSFAMCAALTLDALRETAHMGPQGEVVAVSIACTLFACGISIAILVYGAKRRRELTRETP